MTEPLEAEVERLSLALHTAQKHPDYDYAMTAGWDTKGEGWELNPGLPSGSYGGTPDNDQYRPAYERPQTYWMRRKGEKE